MSPDLHYSRATLDWNSKKWFWDPEDFHAWTGLNPKSLEYTTKWFDSPIINGCKFLFSFCTQVQKRFDSHDGKKPLCKSVVLICPNWVYHLGMPIEFFTVPLLKDVFLDQTFCAGALFLLYSNFQQFREPYFHWNETLAYSTQTSQLKAKSPSRD